MESSPDPSFDLDNHASALRAATKSILPVRRRMAIEDAEHIVKAEFERHGISLNPHAVKHYARTLHAKPLSPWFIRVLSTDWPWLSRRGPEYDSRWRTCFGSPVAAAKTLLWLCWVSFLLAVFAGMVYLLLLGVLWIFD